MTHSLKYYLSFIYYIIIDYSFLYYVVNAYVIITFIHFLYYVFIKHVDKIKRYFY